MPDSPTALNAGALRSPQDRVRPRKRFLLAAAAAFLACLSLMLPYELPVWEFVLSNRQPLVAWMTEFIADTSPYLLWLLAFPAFWLCRTHLLDPTSSLVERAETWLLAGRYPQSTAATDQSTPAPQPRFDKLLLGALLLIGLLGTSRALLIGSAFTGLPPAFHDEYSYLFQAETFLQGCVVNPGFAAAPELFDQMHVLNQPGHFASRYFPGTGLYLALFLPAGLPYLGYAIAQGLFCVLIGLIARDLSGNGPGLLAGLLTALMPGMGLFANLLLAHHPGLLGWGLFMWMFGRWWHRRSLGLAILAGLGLSYAMLCRPMTAFGLSLPYGVLFLLVLFREPLSWKQRLQSAAAMGGPIVLTLILLLPYHAAITGSARVSPYQQYTQLHTPRHTYGFYNRSRGEAWIAQYEQAGQPLPVIEHYDRWATELTPRSALQNLKNRWLASGQWSIGIIPTLATLVFFLLIGHADRPLWWGPLLAYFSLHLVHLPYWYDGIMHWHYVFETAPLIALLFARCAELICIQCRRWDRHWIGVWWLALPIIGITICSTTFLPLWSSQLEAGLSELQFSRQRHAAFNTAIANLEQPAVVFVQPDPTDLHLDYVFNSPTLNTPTLRARWLPEKYPLPELQQLFPHRHLYLATPTNESIQIQHLARPEREE